MVDFEIAVPKCHRYIISRNQREGLLVPLQSDDIPTDPVVRLAKQVQGRRRLRTQGSYACCTGARSKFFLGGCQGRRTEVGVTTVFN